MLKQILAISALWSAASLAATCVPGGDTSIIAHTGPTVGTEQVVDGVTMYVSKPSSCASTIVADTAVLYLTDVFGINLTENRALADSFARAGYLTVAPDLFDGQPAPSDINGTGPAFNSTAFLLQHGPEVTDPIIEGAISFIRSSFNVTKVAVTGYCFGGRYSFRFVNPARSVRADVAFAAHPSAWVDDEITALGFPTSVATADNDNLLPVARRNTLEALLLNKTATLPYQVNLYSGVAHGFGVRANVTDPKQRFAKETAFLQAVRWFEYFA